MQAFKNDISFIRAACPLKMKPIFKTIFYKNYPLLCSVPNYSISYSFYVTFKYFRRNSVLRPSLLCWSLRLMDYNFVL
jgi:hypothetical protein